MKCIVLFLAVCLASAYGELIDTESEALVTECVNESGVDIEKLKEMVKTGNWLINRKIGCYLACLMKKQGTMTADGVIVPPTDLKDDPKENCFKLTGVDACDTAARILECGLKIEQEAKKANEKKD